MQSPSLSSTFAADRPQLPRLTTHPKAVTWLRAAMATALAGSVLLLAYVGVVTRERAVTEGRARLARIAQVGQEQAQRIVETNEVISRSVASAVQGRSNGELQGQRAELHGLLAAVTRDVRQLQSVWIWDDRGHPIATNLRPDPPPSLDVSDREYFRWARATRDSGWYVSHPLRSRITGQLFFDFCKRRSNPDGSFAGAISVSLLPDYFTQLFREQVLHEPVFAISLVLADGTVVARFPQAPEGARLGDESPTLRAMKAQVPAGEVSGISSIDHTWRYVAFRRVNDLPLYVVATARQDLLLGAWQRSMTLLALFTVPLALALAGMCWFALRRVRREHAVAVAHQEQYEQRLRAEEALRQAQKMEALGRLTGGVAHDFNNVLMVVQSNAALARMLAQRGNAVEPALATIERAVRNGAQLTRQLLAIARRQPLQVRAVRLQSVLPEVARLMASTLGSRIRVSCEVDSEVCPVTLDEAELELAVINLCLNARDAMPEGGEIRIRAELLHAPADLPQQAACAQLTVRDTGEGIPSELISKVTEPFFTTKAAGKGTGLGLSQVYSFVQQCGGRLRIDSEVGRGTVVSLLLPCAAAGSPEQAPEAQDEVVRLDARVLLVEDNPDIAGSLAGLLVHAGARVTRYASAEAAIEAVQGGEHADVVLSDICLEGALTGVDLARTLAREHPGVPVVLVTGYTDRLEEAVALGFQVLPKPAPAQDVVHALHQALKRKQAAAAADAVAVAPAS